MSAAVMGVAVDVVRSAYYDRHGRAVARAAFDGDAWQVALVAWFTHATTVAPGPYLDHTLGCRDEV